ncbi:MAG TPA: DUF835 domain-containing protein [Euryarchaeota archaeon]|nr:DUF835 domain-containing protein [Euryarchaeota archaeon]
MASELRIPEGIVVRTARGGTEILRNILNDLKQYSFSGYIKVILKKDTMNSTGYLVIEQGTPAMSIYQFEKSEPREIKRIYAGDKSLRFIWEDSQDKLSLIELHSRVPKEEFDRRFPDAKLTVTEEFEAQISKPQKPKKLRVTVSKRDKEMEGTPEDEKEEDPIWQEIQKIRRQGYQVEELEEIYGVNRSAAKRELAAYQEKVEELKKLEKMLDNLPNVGLDEEIARVKKGLNSPRQLEEIKEEFEILKDLTKQRIEKTKVAEKKIEEDLKRKKQQEKVGDLYDLILQYQSGSIPSAEASVCPKCGGILDGSGVCSKCAEGGEEEVQTFPDSMVFENFVVGNNCKFAYAAAVAVAHAPDKAYNPLYIYGKTGLGKTHLLNAIAKYIVGSSSGISVSLLRCEKFAEELDHAMKTERMTKFRSSYRNRKILLIDDFQFVAGKELAQEEMLYLVEETLRNGGQIVVASDRLPAEIPRLNERLAAKIQGGLIADIQLPDKDTRMQILKMKITEKGKGKELNEQVLEYISEHVKTNVRELEAALNRLIAFSAVMKLEIDLQLAKEVLSPTITSTASPEALQFDIDIMPGHSYLIEEERPIQSNRLLMKKIEEGYKGLEVTRMNPHQVREKFGSLAEILWLTDKDSQTEKTVSPSLEMIMHLIEEFNLKTEKGIVLLDGLQYLISNTSFEGVLRFIRRLIDEFSESSSTLMISISPGTLKSQELSILEREMEIIKFS